MWKTLMEEHDIQTIFIESMCDNLEIIEQNVRSVKISSPDVCCSLGDADVVHWMESR